MLEDDGISFLAELYLTGSQAQSWLLEPAASPIRLCLHGDFERD